MCRLPVQDKDRRRCSRHHRGAELEFVACLHQRFESLDTAESLDLMDPVPAGARGDLRGRGEK